MQAVVRGFISSRMAAVMAAAALVASLGSCTTAPGPPGQQSPTVQSTATARPTPAFAAVLEKYSEDMRAAGATAVIIQMKSRVGDWSSAEGVRTLENQEPVQLTDQTHIGDITMTMVAVSVMKLVEEGKVQLDDPIQKHLPHFESIIKPPGPITIRSLLSHRSGMPHYWDSPIDIGNRRFTHEERLGFAAAIPWRQRQLGPYRYSNTNYSALALLVEKLRGRGIGAVIHTDNVEPLELKDTLMSGGDPGPQRMIHGYTEENGELSDNTLAPFHAGSPDTGMISTVPDLNTYFAALQKGSLLTRPSLQEMHHPKYEEFGLGVVRRYDECSNNAYFGHVGVVRGYAALALISEDGSRQVAIAVARAPAPDLIGFDDGRSLEMAEAAVNALNLAC